MDTIIRAVKNQYNHYQDNKVISKENFKDKHTFEKRLEESCRIMEKYPDRVPIICERLTRKAPEIDRKKLEKFRTNLRNFRKICEMFENFEKVLKAYFCTGV